MNILPIKYSSSSTHYSTFSGFWRAKCLPTWVGSFHHPISILKYKKLILKQNGANTFLIGFKQNRNGLADQIFRTSDCILARSSLVLLLAVKIQEGKSVSTVVCIGGNLTQGINPTTQPSSSLLLHIPRYETSLPV